MSRPQDDRNQEATVYLVSVTLNVCMAKLNLERQGNLDERCTDALVWELMLQAGPVGEWSF
jgi:splicing factor 3B subunit 4